MEEPVDTILQSDDKVQVITKKGNRYEAKYLIMACSPTMSGRITYSPPLPSSRDELSQRFSMGRVIKCLAFYKERFWRSKGMSGEIVSEDDIITMGFDASSPDGSSSVLVGFICGEYARKMSLVSQEVKLKSFLSISRFTGAKERSFEMFCQIFW